MRNLVIYKDDEIILETNIVKVNTSIGKNPDADILLKGWSLNKIHANLIINDEDVFIEDCSSMFGTYVNNVRVVRYGPIKNTDIINIGSYTLSIISINDTEKNHALEKNTSVTTFISDKKNSVENLLSASEITPKQIPSSSEGEPVLSILQIAASSASAHNTAARNQINDKTGDRMPTRTNERSAEYVLFMEWLRIVHSALLNEIDKRRIDVNRLNDVELRSNIRLLIKEIIKAIPDLPKSIDVSELTLQVLNEAIGLGPLEPLLADEEVTEIMINKFDEIWIEKRGQLTLSGSSFTSDAAVLGAIERIVTPLGRRIDESSPMVDARLKDGSRVNAIIPPLAIRGPSLTIRKFSKRQIGASDFVKFGSLTDEMVALIRQIIGLRLNIVVSGGTGTGKTTFLNMIANFVEDHERIVTIEDAAELKLSQPNLVSLESRPANLEGKGMIAIRDLVRNSLRMRPDRILVGECRGGEALDMLQAMNTGHDGSMTTLHSNSPRDAMARLEVLVLMAGMNLPVRAIREQIASAVQVVVQLTRFSCGSRKVTSISEIIGMESEIIQMQEVYRFRKTGKDADGKTTGLFEYSGLKPDFLKKLEN